MNAKIKSTLLVLASVGMLASCNSGTNLSRAEAETELDSYSKHIPTQSKVTYNDKTVKDGKAASSAIIDTTEVYAYRQFDVETGTFKAGSKYYAYKNGDKYYFASIVGSTKSYLESTETVVKAAVTAALTAVTGYANYQASGTSAWLKGFDKSESWMSSNSKDKDATATYGEGYGGGSVKGYVKAESYKKYSDGAMKADITAIYPFQSDMVSMGGENCIYEWKDYQLTRLYNNYQNYEETLDWTKASTNDKPVDANTWTKDLTLALTATAAIATFAHAWSD